MLSLVHEWESKGLVAEWKEKFGSFDFLTQKFIDITQVDKFLFQSIYCCDIHKYSAFSELGDCNNR